MATITIKIDSEELARDVFAHLGYLPKDDMSYEEEDDDDEEEEIDIKLEDTK